MALSSAPFQQWRLPDGAVWADFHRVDAGYLLRFPQLADFIVSADGLRVDSHLAPGCDEATLEHLYCNQIVPLALSRQGELVLHASAVEVDGGCIAFMGTTGQGKSTLATSFATAGHAVLTDDSLRLRWEHGQPQALPSHASVRLWQDSEQALLPWPRHTLAPAVAYTSKARVLAGGSLTFCTEPRPLLAVFHLDACASEAVHIAPARSADMLIHLVRNSFLLDVEERAGIAAHFDALARIAALPLHNRLVYPRDYAALPEVRAAILRHSSSGA